MNSHQIADRVAELLTEAGDDGLTRLEIRRKCRAYRRLTTPESDEVDNLLMRDHGIIEPVMSIGGRSRLALLKFYITEPSPTTKRAVGGSISGDGMSYSNSGELFAAYRRFHHLHREKLESGHFVKGLIKDGRTYYFRSRKSDAFIAERYKVYFEVWDGNQPHSDYPDKPVSNGVFIYSAEADALKSLHIIEG